jgi:hypothetical protein
MTPRGVASFRLDSELIEGLQAVWERDGVAPSEQVRRAVKMWLESKSVNVKSAPKAREGPQGRLSWAR